MTRKTFIVPGYRIRSRAAIYGGGHHSQGQKVWGRYQELLKMVNHETGKLYYVRDGVPHLWVEFGPTYGVEYWEDDTLVEVR